MKENLQQLLLILLRDKGPHRVDELAQELHVSNRTVRYWLEEVEILLEAYNLKLMRKPKVGVWIEGSPEDLGYVVSKVRQGVWEEKYSPGHRQLLILQEVLAGPTPILRLSDKLYVSRMTIYNDLDGVREYLQNYDLELVNRKNRGLVVEGDESGIRRATADLLPKLSAYSDSDSGPVPVRRVDGGTYRQLTKLFPAHDISLFEAVLEEAENRLRFRFADEAFVCLVVHIALTMERLRQGKDITMPREQMEMVRQKEEFEVARWITARISLIAGVSIPESETGYICMHILGSKLQQRVDSEEAEDLVAKLEPQTIKITQEIIAVAEAILGFELAHDRLLLAGLALHLRPALNRLRHGLSIRNPILAMIKENYPELMNAAWATSKVFEQHLGVTISEPEVGFIAMHLGAALERLRKRKRVLLVCSSGMGTAQLLNTRLESAFPNLDVVDVVSSYQYSQGNLPNVDLIISTVPLEAKSIPVIQVSPFLNQQDIQAISRYTIRGNQDPKKSIPVLTDLVTPDLVFLDFEAAGQEQIIGFLAARLKATGVVTEDYRAGVLAREKLASTAVGRGVAIPHTFQEHVQSSRVAVARLKTPIQWGEDEVDLVFMLALKFNREEKTWQMFRSFYRLLDNREFLSRLRAATSPSQFVEIIRGYREE
ncbi:MAG: transcription antiterminator [Firmicutes bacterium]|nr:transcription antiterminator [Bacillota bacterium]